MFYVVLVTVFNKSLPGGSRSAGTMFSFLISRRPAAETEVDSLNAHTTKMFQ